ncbi:transposable element Tc3 transposase [Trichonephila clavipes]|nr:transposable element Tc3 transposase [Trichonephila clavipes]
MLALPNYAASQVTRCEIKYTHIHWCAKIKDEVEKLAYQLNEEAEQTERPIRRLRTAIRGFSSGRPRGTTPQMTGTLSYKPEETGGRQREKSLDTRNRRLDDRYRVLPWPEDCTVVVCFHDALYEALWVCSSFFMDDNAPCHRTVAAEQLLESRRLAARTLPPVIIRELRLALQDEWAAMPQQLIDTLILSMGRRCETCLAVRGDHIPY